MTDGLLGVVSFDRPARDVLSWRESSALRTINPMVAWCSRDKARPGVDDVPVWQMISAGGEIVPDPRAESVSEPEAWRRDPHRAALNCYGTEFARHVLGQFQLIAWRQDERRLLVVNDNIGSIPFYYVARPGYLAFASDAADLISAGAASAEVNTDRIADHLLRLPSARDTTFFREIRRLPPGHLLEFSPGGMVVRDWWQPERIPQADVSVAEFYEQIRDAFRDAVRRNLPTTGNTGLFLSGGLDSGAIAGVASSLMPEDRQIFGYCVYPENPLDVAPRPGWDVTEDTYLDALESYLPNLTTRRLAMNGGTPLLGLEAATRRRAAPVFELNHFWLHGLMQAARADGIDRVLTGQLGNPALSWEDFFMPARLVRKGQLVRALREIWATAQRDKTGLSEIFMLELVQPLRRGYRAPRLNGDLFRFSPISEEFLGATDAKARILDMQHQLARQRQPRDNMLMQLAPGQNRLGETIFAEARSLGMDMRDPTADRMVIELCLSAPESSFRSNGQRRLAIREAMAGSVPPEIRNRTTRGMQCPDMMHRFDRERDQVRCMLMRFAASDVFASYVDVQRLLEQSHQPLTEPSMHSLWRAVTLGVFLESFASGARKVAA